MKTIPHIVGLRFTRARATEALRPGMLRAVAPAMRVTLALALLTTAMGCASWRNRVSGDSWTQRAQQEEQRPVSDPSAGPW